MACTRTIRTDARRVHPRDAAKSEDGCAVLAADKYIAHDEDACPVSPVLVFIRARRSAIPACAWSGWGVIPSVNPSWQIYAARITNSMSTVL